MRFFARKRQRTIGFLRSLLLLSIQIELACALTNVTVDDETGDALTGDKPTYTPSGTNGNWVQGSTCSGCFVKPDASKAHGGTWHDATHGANDPFQRAIEVNFIGTAVYTYFICANTVKDATTLTNLTFALDGGQVGTFVHVPKATTDFEYNVLGYAGTNLSKGQHQLIIQTTGDASDSLILFDYLIYSTDQVISSTSSKSATSTTSTTKTATSHTSSASTTPTGQPSGTGGSSKTGPIVGAVVGVVGAAAIAALAFLCWRRRNGGGGMFFGRRKRANVNLDEDGSEYSMNNAAAPMPYTMSQSNSSELIRPNMAESQYLMPSAERAGTISGSTHPSMAATNSASLAVQNPDGSDVGRSDVSAASIAADVGAVGVSSGEVRKARERQTEIARQVEEMQQRVAILRSRSVRNRQRDSLSGSVAGTTTDSEAELRNHIAALQAEVERLQTQREYFQQLGWGDEPPPQYVEDDGVGHAVPRHS